VAVDRAEQVLGELRVRSSEGQLQRLMSWAVQWPERTWAVEGAGGLGYLLAQQLVGAGETVLDVQPKLGARVRLLATGNVNKNDPNDARSVAVAALRSKDMPRVGLEDQAAVMKLWAKRRRDLGALRTQVVCRLHAVLCELVPGGMPGKEVSAAQAARALAAVKPMGAVAQARYELAMDFLADLRRTDTQMLETKKRFEVAVKASGTPSPRSSASGRTSPPPWPAMSATPPALPAGTTSPPTTAPHLSKFPHAGTRFSVSPGGATASSTMPSTWPLSPRWPTATATAAPITSAS
jgi:transposase